MTNPDQLLLKISKNKQTTKYYNFYVLIIKFKKSFED